MRLVASLLAALFPPRCERICDLVPGRRALVRGKVVPRDFIDSTLTGERCVYYRYSVDQWRNTHVAGLGSEGHWSMVRSDEAIVEFYLQDDNGDRLIVSPQRVRVDRSNNVHPKSIDMGIYRQRAQELTISAGDVIEVQGIVSLVDDLYDHDRDFRSNASRTMLVAPDSDTLDITLVDSSHRSSEI